MQCLYLTRRASNNNNEKNTDFILSRKWRHSTEHADGAVLNRLTEIPHHLMLIRRRRQEFYDVNEEDVARCSL